MEDSSSTKDPVPAGSAAVTSTCGSSLAAATVTAAATMEDGDRTETAAGGRDVEEAHTRSSSSAGRVGRHCVGRSLPPWICRHTGAPQSTAAGASPTGTGVKVK